MIVWMVWGLGALASAQTADERFVRANQAYDEGDFAAAVEQYQALVAEGASSGHVHYNLGNAYLRSGALGEAIASYRRAERALPRDGDVRANLAFARNATKDATAPPAPSPVWRTVFFWHFALSWGELATLVGVINVLFWGAWVGRLLRPAAEVWRWAVWGLGVPLVALGGSLLVRALFPNPVAVVVSDQVDVRAGTNEDAVVRFTLNEGTEARLVDAHADWLRIRLSDGNRGWVPAADVAVVD